MVTMHKGRPAAYGHQRGKGNDDNAAGLGLEHGNLGRDAANTRKAEEKSPRT